MLISDKYMQGCLDKLIFNNLKFHLVIENPQATLKNNIFNKNHNFCQYFY